MSTRALSHLRVLDLGHHRAGPFAAKLLADFGADVIKVERPGTGDPARQIGFPVLAAPEGSPSALFVYLNAGKRSVCLDLKSLSGQRALDRLAEHVDVILENFRPRTRVALGITSERLSARNPRLVLTSISNFGQDGPHRDWEATELIEYAAGGLMYITGLNAAEPLKHGLGQAQYLAGSLAASGSLMSVFGARRSGAGDHVDISIQEVIASGLQSTLMYYSFMGAARWRNPELGTNTNDIYPCADGYVVPGIGGFGDWDAYCTFFDSPELADERFQTRDGRLRHRKELSALLVDRLQGWKRHDLFHQGQAWGFPFGVVQTPDDVLACPHLADREWWQEQQVAESIRLRVPGPLFRLTASPAAAPRPAPALGQHTDEVLREIGLDPAEFAGSLPRATDR